MPDNTSLYKAVRLFVVGNINRDIKTAPFPPGQYLFDDGETSVPLITETIGGGGANSAFAAANLGLKVAFAGKVGNDALGERLEQLLLRCGLASYLKKEDGLSTGTSIGLNFESGNRHFLSNLPNNRSLCLEDLDLSQMHSYEYLLRADVWFSEPMLYGGNERLLQRAKQARLTTSIDLNWDPCWNAGGHREITKRKDAIRRLLSLIDIVHGNIQELNEFCDSDDLDRTLSCLEEWGAGCVVLHLGSQGAGFYREGKLVVHKPYPTKRQVNTTGTGDVLSVCMIALHHQQGLSIHEKLRIANKTVAAFVEGRLSLLPELH